MSDEAGHSEQQSATTTATETGDNWGDPISPKRQDALQEYLDRWKAENGHGERKGPFDLGKDKHGYQLRVQLTGADVYWLAEQSGRNEYDQVPNLHLERANLSYAHLERAGLSKAHLEQATLGWAEGADLRRAHLEGANLATAHLAGSSLAEAHLEDAILAYAHLEGTNNGDAHLERANLSFAYLDGAFLDRAHLAGADLRNTHLEGTKLDEAHLEGKTLPPEDLERIRQWEPDFPEDLPPADPRLAFLNEATTLNDICLGDTAHGYVRTADVRWGGVNLAVVDLPPACLLGDEREAHQVNDSNGKPKDRATRLDDYRAAVRANRQIAVALQSLGLNEEAAPFAYRAQVLQRQVLLRQRNIGAYLFSLLIASLAGYGYRLGRILIAYGLIVTVFAAGFFFTGHALSSPGLTGQSLVQGVLDAFQISLNAIHGRVFFAQFGLDTAQSWLATAESILGIVIEGVFVAMLIQRFFGR